MGLQPVSGKRHQLRAHLSALGAPILGDPFYPRLSRAADAPDDLAAPMQLLARSLHFADPVTGETRAFRSALHLTALPPGA